MAEGLPRSAFIADCVAANSAGNRWNEAKRTGNLLLRIDRHRWCLHNANKVVSPAGRAMGGMPAIVVFGKRAGSTFPTCLVSFHYTHFEPLGNRKMIEIIFAQRAFLW